MEVTHLKKNKYISNTEGNISHIKGHVQDNQEEMDDIDLYETVAPNNVLYENTRIAVSVLDNANSGLNEYYETLQTTPKEDSKSKVSKSFWTTDAKQKVALLILVLTGVLISSVSLVITLTIQEKAQAVDGSWSSWELWEACSTTCDEGMQRRHRNCSNPAPLGYGRQCLGVDNEHRLCMPGPCSNEGLWSEWESWEACSTSCDVGMQRRQRNCSNLASKGSGRHCLGYDNEHKLCMPGPCFNGGWSAWGSWGSCSASCDVGLKSRYRTCTSPRPSLFGRFCEGDNMQVEMCESNQCKDGGWSAWGSWGSCSASCDVGLKSRYRTCTSPRPSLFGRFCEGDNMQVEMCESNQCKDGGWSAWGSWGSCSASCDAGLKSRYRTCTIPRPSLFGRFCEGDNMQVEMCESNQCKETHVAFNVYQSSVTGNSGSHTVIFTKILLNEAGAYNKTTGVFTAPFSGLYQFNGQICTVVGKDVDYTLQTYGRSFASGEHRTSSDASDGKCTSFSAVASVLKHEKVWITSSYLFQNNSDWNSFSGILIHKK